MPPKDPIAWLKILVTSHPKNIKQWHVSFAVKKYDWANSWSLNEEQSQLAWRYRNDLPKYSLEFPPELLEKLIELTPRLSGGWVEEEIWTTVLQLHHKPLPQDLGLRLEKESKSSEVLRALSNSHQDLLVYYRLAHRKDSYKIRLLRRLFIEEKYPVEELGRFLEKFGYKGIYTHLFRKVPSSEEKYQFFKEEEVQLLKNSLRQEELDPSKPQARKQWKRIRNQKTQLGIPLYIRDPGAFRKEVMNRLSEENTDGSRKKLAKYIHHTNVELKDLLKILRIQNNKVALHFSWVIGDLGEQKPEYVFAALPELFAMRDEVHFSGFHRTVAKALYLAGFPDEIEGEATEVLFQWLLDTKEEVTTKSYAAKALLHPAQKHPDLRRELRIVLQDQLTKNTASFKKTARQVLAELNMMEFSEDK